MKRVRQFLTQNAHLVSGDTLIVGVSGGADSLCLLHVLAALRSAYGIAIHVAHFDHMLRGAASAADAIFVQQMSAALELPVTVERADVATLAHESGANLHDLARVLRYRFFARLADTLGASAVAVAHTADDQAETVLMHLLRGAGTTGLRGMLPISDMGFLVEDASATLRNQQPPLANRQLRLLRPLLTSTRAEIETYCVAQQLTWRDDATNHDVHYTRNHIRHVLLPGLRRTYPRVNAALNRTAAICADDAGFIEQSLAALWPALAHTAPGAVTLDGTAWRALHPALQRAALRRAYALLANSETLPWERIEAARALVGQTGKQLELPGGIRLVTSYNSATLYGSGQPPHPNGPQLAAETIELALPAQIALEHGWELHAAMCAAPVPAAAHRWETYLDAAALPQQLAVRRRCPSDRLRPDNGRGSRSIQDVFVDAKIPRDARACWPLVATPDAIVWVPGIRAADGFIATATSTCAIHIWITSPHVDYTID